MAGIAAVCHKAAGQRRIRSACKVGNGSIDTRAAQLRRSVIPSDGQDHSEVDRFCRRSAIHRRHRAVHTAVTGSICAGCRPTRRTQRHARYLFAYRGRRDAHAKPARGAIGLHDEPAGRSCRTLPAGQKPTPGQRGRGGEDNVKPVTVSKA